MPLDRESFRMVMAAFPTGVTVVTTVDRDGQPKGLTLQSFLAVSTDPPLLLVSVDRESRTLAALNERGAFVVNFLAARRERLSNTFASKDEDKFADVSWRPSTVARGAPILAADCVAYAECLVTQRIETGDHWLFLASVEAGEYLGGTPLMYLRRRYTAWPDERLVPQAPAPDAWTSF